MIASMTIGLWAFLIGAGLLGWACLGSLPQARWLGASLVASTLVVSVIAAGLIGIVVTAWIGAPTWIVIGVAVAPTAFLRLKLRWIVEGTGGLRPEAASLYAFRRLHSPYSRVLGAQIPPKDALDSLSQLDALDEFRTPATTALIDTIQRMGRLYVQPDADPLSVRESQETFEAAADRTWGRAWRIRS